MSHGPHGVKGQTRGAVQSKGQRQGLCLGDSRKARGPEQGESGDEAREAQGLGDGRSPVAGKGRACLFCDGDGESLDAPVV